MYKTFILPLSFNEQSTVKMKLVREILLKKHGNIIILRNAFF